MASIDEVRLVKLAQELIRIPSANPPGEEKEVANFLGQYLRSMGLRVQIKDVTQHPGRPNVIGTWEGIDSKGPTLLLNGHLDVLPPGEGWTVDPYGGEIVDGRIYGRGATDMKGPLAAMVETVNAVKKAGVSLRGTVKIAGVVGEEDDQSGTKQLAQDRFKADFAIIGEPTTLKPVIAHKGNIYFDIKTKGVAAHASVPHLGVNAIAKMFHVVKGIEDLSERLKQKKDEILGHPTLSIGQIQGGVVTNIVADSCTMSVDRRLIPGETPEQARQEFLDLFQRIRSSDPEFEAELTMPVVSPPMAISGDETIVRVLQATVKEVLGEDPGVHGMAGTCDANILVNELGIPTGVFGPGDLSAQAHRPDEYIEIDQLLKATKIYSLTLLELLE